MSEMSEMVERVELAMFKATALQNEPWPASEAHPTRKYFRRQARVAIAAMREPTQDMIDAGEGADDHSTRYAEAADCLTHWHAMIDAALEEG